MTKYPIELRQSRELAIQTLYQLVNAPDYMTKEAAIDYTFSAGSDPDAGITEAPSEYFYTLVDGVLSHQDELDKIIEKYLTNWNFNRITALDLTILRIAFFEIEFNETNDVPVIAAINEAIELSKTFSDDKSRRFISGILGKASQTYVANNKIDSTEAQTIENEK